MALRKPLAALAGLVAGAGAVVAADRSLATLAGPLAPALSGDQRTYRWRGFDVAYAEAGDPDDPDVLLVHGLHAAASSQEFDRVFDALAEDHHVVAPDLPGFGRSDRPPVAYTADFYRDFLVDFGAEVTDDATCVATSLSGAHAALAAPEAGFERLVLVCPLADTAPRRDWLRALFRSPVVGTALFDLLVCRPSLAWFDAREGYAEGADAATVDYQWRTAHQSGARFAPASFVGGWLDPDVDLGATLADLDVPVTLVWGTAAERPPITDGRALADRADARLVTVSRSRLLPHAERPEAFVDAISTDLPA